MVTTFERLAKVLKGYIKPANWIERAFASIGSALPSVTAADEGKVLTVNSSGEWDAEDASGGLPSYTSGDKDKVLSIVNETEIVSIVDEQTVTIDENYRGALAANSYHPSIATGIDKCVAVINSVEYTLEYFNDGSQSGYSSSDITINLTGSNAGYITVIGETGPITFKAYGEKELETVAPNWRKSPGIVYFNIELTTQDDVNYTVDKTWDEIGEAYAAGKLLVCTGGGWGSILVYAGDSYVASTNNAWTGVLRHITITWNDRSGSIAVNVTDFQCANSASAN